MCVCAFCFNLGDTKIFHTSGKMGSLLFLLESAIIYATELFICQMHEVLLVMGEPPRRCLESHWLFVANQACGCDTAQTLQQRYLGYPEPAGHIQGCNRDIQGATWCQKLNLCPELPWVH